MPVIFAAFFLIAMLGGVCGLAAVCPHDLAPIAATTVFILALAACAATIR